MRPYPLAAGFQRANFYQWGHLRPSSDWEVLSRCPDQDALIAMRQIGKGRIVAVAPAEFASRSELLHNLLENVRIFNRNQAAGIQWEAYEFDGNQPQFRTRWRNLGDKPQRIAGSFALVAADGRVLKQENFDHQIQPGGVREWTIPVLLEPESSGLLKLSLASPAKWENSRSVSRAPRIAMTLPRQRIYRYQASAFTVDLHRPEANGTDNAIPHPVLNPEAPLRVSMMEPGRMTLDWSKCPAGTYRLKIELRSPDGSVVGSTPFESVVLDDHVPYIQVDEQQKIRRNGQRIFPIGFYHVSWNLSDADRLACLNYCARNGYNLLHASWRPNEEIDSLVKAAREKKVMLFLEGVNPERIARWNTETSILGWGLRDEPDLALVDPGVLAAEYTKWKIAAPNHLLSTVLVFPGSFRDYRRTADLVGHDYYPILSGNRDLTSVFANHCRLRTEIGEWRAPLAVIQAFGYPSGFAVPTLAELRNMVYQTLAANPSGILFYAWNDGIFTLEKHPELDIWLRQLPKELKAYLPFLLNGSWKRVATGNNAVVGGSWTLGKRELRILCNTSRSKQSFSMDRSPRTLDPLDVVVEINSL